MLEKQDLSSNRWDSNLKRSIEKIQRVKRL